MSMLGCCFILSVESFNLVSNAWHHDVRVIGDVPKSVDNDSEVFVLKCLKYFFKLEAVSHSETS